MPRSSLSTASSGSVSDGSVVTAESVASTGATGPEPDGAAASLAVADSVPLLAEGCRRILADVPGTQVVAVTGADQNLLTTAEAHPLDILVFGLHPRGCGLSLLRELMQMQGDVEVVVLGTGEDELEERKVKDAGASVYLPRTAGPDALRAAVRSAAQRLNLPPGSPAEDGARPRSGPEHGPEAIESILSDREMQVFCRIARGYPPKAIAEDLDIRPPTVSTYRSRILHKLQLQNNVEIAHCALRHRVVSYL